MNKQQLASKIWESANKMRSKIEAHEYKDYILGFMFYKYISDYEVEFLRENDYSDEDLKAVTEDDQETVKFLQDEIGYFIAYPHLFSTWVEKGQDFDVDDVTTALSAFSRLIGASYRKVFEDIFLTLHNGLSKLGESSGARTKAIRSLIDLIQGIPMDGKQGYDVLGFVYEYLISMFAANAGKKAGEFYTPHEVSVLMSEIVADHLKDKEEIKIYDPTSGSGSLLINIGESIAKYANNSGNIKYYAQELKENTYNLTRMNLVMRGIKAVNILTRNGDTLEEDWPYFDETDPDATYDPLYVDAVVSNPPYSQSWDPVGKDNDPRYSRFGLAPKSKADYAFLLHDLYHVKPNGIMTIVLPHGVLFRGGEEGKIRENLIEQNHIDAIIGLPSNIFFGTGIPTIVIVLRQQRENTDVLLIDASKGFVKEGKNNKLRSSDIRKIADVVKNRLDIPKFSRCVSKEEIRQNEYNLNIPRYVDSSEKAESYDIYATMFGGIPLAELEDFSEYWTAFPDLKSALFQGDGTPYVSLSCENLKETLENHPNIKTFHQDFQTAFTGFDEDLHKTLIDGATTVEVNKIKAELAKNLFARLEPVALLDKYHGYQVLSNHWEGISEDLEMIQTEGFDCVKQVDPNIVIKKKDSKEVEVQEGYIGHILPFDLVQKVHLSEELTGLKEKETQLSTIPSEFEELLDSLTEEEKDSDICNEAGDSFVMKVVSSKVKALKKSTESEEKALYAKLLQVEALSKTEKDLKKQIKADSTALHLKTKDFIEGLTEEQVTNLLHLKWISPLQEEILAMTASFIGAFTTKLEALSQKYAVTYQETQEEIEKCEASLSAMMDQLVGSEFDMKGITELKKLLGGE